MTSLHLCIRCLACLLGLTTYHKSLSALILHVLCHVLIQKELEDGKDVNHEQSTSSIATTRTEITRGLAYSESRAIEVAHGNLLMSFVFIA